MRQLDIEKIESIRLDREFTKTKFCQAIGMSIRTYNNLGNGKVHDETILKLAKILDLRPSEIIVFKNHDLQTQR